MFMKISMLAAIGVATVISGMVAMRSSMDIVAGRVAEARDVYRVIPRPLYAMPDSVIDAVPDQSESDLLRHARLEADVEWCRAMLASADADALMVKASKAGILDASPLVRDAGIKAEESLAASARCSPLYAIANRQFAALTQPRAE